ncbi:MAG: hypothetical protein MI742_08955 [Desulfobacterales bacterium]|nr:hypothetical protein [Desulfobacterales bacterium]
MIEQKERHLDVSMCHRCLMRQKSELSSMEPMDEMQISTEVSWLDDGAYAVIPEISPQICQILSIGYTSMRFVYFSKNPFTIGGLSSAEIVAVGHGFIADHIPFKVVKDGLFDESGEEEDQEEKKRVCEVEILEIGEASRIQIDHVISLKGRPLQ